MVVVIVAVIVVVVVVACCHVFVRILVLGLVVVLAPVLDLVRQCACTTSLQELFFCLSVLAKEIIAI